MRTSILSVLLIILVSLLKEIKAYPNVKECAVSDIQPGIHTNMTLQLTYNGESHSCTEIEIPDKILIDIDQSCDGVWASHLTITGCFQNDYGSYTNIYIIYSPTTIQSTNITLSGITYPLQSITLDNYPRTYVYNSNAPMYTLCRTNITTPSYAIQLTSM